jgi:hypothetical protein
MSTQPIETARDPDLRLSHQALLRAAQRAHEVAARTGTSIVISRAGVVKHIQPQLEISYPRVEEGAAAYGGQR